MKKQEIITLSIAIFIIFFGGITLHDKIDLYDSSRTEKATIQRDLTGLSIDSGVGGILKLNVAGTEFIGLSDEIYINKNINMNENYITGLTNAINNSDVAILADVVSYSTNTGNVTGITDLTLDKTAISDRSDNTIVASDYIIYGDSSDSDNLKKDTVQGILDLAGSDFIPAYGVYGKNQTNVSAGVCTTHGTYYKMTGFDIVINEYNVTAGDNGFTIETSGLYQINITGEIYTNANNYTNHKIFKNNTGVDSSTYYRKLLNATKESFNYCCYLELKSDDFIDYRVSHVTDDSKNMLLYMPIFSILKISD